ncbi:MAG: hypothetical protein AAF995_04265 [Planctomycetota bacterium]
MNVPVRQHAPLIIVLLSAWLATLVGCDESANVDSGRAQASERAGGGLDSDVGATNYQLELARELERDGLRSVSTEVIAGVHRTPLEPRPIAFTLLESDDPTVVCITSNTGRICISLRPEQVREWRNNLPEVGRSLSSEDRVFMFEQLDALFRTLMYEAADADLAEPFWRLAQVRMMLRADWDEHWPGELPQERLGEELDTLELLMKNASGSGQIFRDRIP